MTLHEPTDLRVYRLRQHIAQLDNLIPGATGKMRRDLLEMRRSARAMLAATERLIEGEP